MSLREELVAQYCKTRTVDCRNAMIDAHRYLCARGARKFSRWNNERADLEQVAALGLIKAANYYRGEMQTPFEAYAWIMIVGELMHYVRDFERLVRIPRRLGALEKRFLRTWDALCASEQREPTTPELALALGVAPAVVGELRALRRGGVVSLADTDAADPHDGVEIAEPRPPIPLDEHISLFVALDELGERERTIVVGTFGIGLTQSELGTRLGLSQSHVSKVLKSALRKIGERVA